MHSKFKLFSQRALVFVINIQLLIPVNGFAENGKTLNNVAGFVQQTANMFGSQMQQMQKQSLSRQRTQELRSLLGIKMADPAQIPEVLSVSGCPVIAANSGDLNMDMQCDGQFDPSLYFSGHYDAYQEIAEENFKAVEGILTPQHNRLSADGITCYEKAQNNFKAQLALRLESLKSKKESINRLVQKFQRKNQNSVEKMRKADALLNGPRGDKKMEDAIKNFKFDKTFGDKECLSYLGGDDFTKIGRSGGIRSIETQIEKSRNEIKPESFKADMNQMKKEIRALGSKLSNEAAETKLMSVDPTAISASKLTTFSPNSKALKTTLERINANAQLKLQKLDRKAVKLVGSDTASEAQEIMEGIKNNTMNDVEFRLTNLERNTKRSCATESFKNQFGSVDKFVSLFKDPNTSDQSNKEADRPFLRFVKSTLNRVDIGIEEMRTLITERQNQKGNSRLVAKLNQTNHFDVGGKTQQIGASEMLRPADIVNIFVSKCTEKFNDEANAQGVSTRDVINGLRKYNSDYKKEQTKFAANIGQELITSLIDCPSDKKTGKATKSCGPEAMNREGQNFCIATANTCASNIMACDAKIKNFISDTRTKQEAIATVYKKEMDDLKMILIRDVNIIAQQVEQESRILDAKYKFGTTYKNPEDISIPLKDDEAIFDKIIKDASLNIEDPIAFQEKVNNSLDKIIAKMESHSNELHAGLSKEVEKYKTNAQKEKSKWETIARQCQNKIDGEYSKYLADLQKAEDDKMKAFNEKRQNECKEYYQFKTDPCPGGEVSEVAGNVAMVAASLGAYATSAQIESTVSACQLHANQSNSTDGSAGGKIANLETINEICSANDKSTTKDSDLLRTCDKLKTKDKEGNDVYYDPLSTEDDQKLCTIDDLNNEQKKDIDKELIGKFCTQNGKKESVWPADTKKGCGGELDEITIDNIEKYKTEFKNKISIDEIKVGKCIDLKEGTVKEQTPQSDCGEGGLLVENGNLEQARPLFLKTDQFESYYKEHNKEHKTKLKCLSEKEVTVQKGINEDWEKAAKKISSISEKRARGKMASESGQLHFAYCDSMNTSPVQEKGYGQQGQDPVGNLMQGFMVQGQ